MKPLDQVAQEAPETKPVAQAEPAMKPVAQAESAMKPVASAKTETIVVEESRAAFAEGIPAWDLLPPEMVVRRKQR